MPQAVPLSLLGTQVSGDLGGLTVYTDRYGRKIWYAEAPPTKPPTTLQLAQRARFKSANDDFTAQSPATKALYEELTHQCRICMTGRNLWISISLGHDRQPLTTLEHQAGFLVPTPTYH